GHDFEPAKCAVSKLGLGLKRRKALRFRPISQLSPSPLRQLLLSISIFKQGDPITLLLECKYQRPADKQALNSVKYKMYAFKHDTSKRHYESA
ncbi:hypothetical protein QP862_02755, partial [Lacticaseibacillus rhamnosus]|uniref:hypothetical protein n=2 Tax=Lacticaseibacillus rhamnosus TaxID=47715 RepID=UPI00254E39B3